MLFFIVFFSAFAIGCLVVALHFTRIAVGFRKNNIATASAYRISTEYMKNVQDRHGKKYYRVGTSRYSYTVDGKTYSVEHSFEGKSPDAPASVNIIYQKSNPKYAKFPGDYRLDWFVAVCFYLLSGNCVYWLIAEFLA